MEERGDDGCLMRLRCDWDGMGLQYVGIAVGWGAVCPRSRFVVCLLEERDLFGSRGSGWELRVGCWWMMVLTAEQLVKVDRQQRAARSGDVEVVHSY